MNVCTSYIAYSEHRTATQQHTRRPKQTKQEPNQANNVKHNTIRTKTKADAKVYQVYILGWNRSTIHLFIAYQHIRANIENCYTLWGLLTMWATRTSNIDER